MEWFPIDEAHAVHMPQLTPPRLPSIAYIIQYPTLSDDENAPFRDVNVTNRISP